jgi:hypothetical protein
MNDVFYVRIQAYFSIWFFGGFAVVCVVLVLSKLVVLDGWWKGVVEGNTFCINAPSFYDELKGENLVAFGL